jgi:hypothetical protein
MVHPDSYRAERSPGGAIVALTLWNATWRVGQEVVSNGRFGPPAGAVGVIEEILLPHENGRTSDVLIVRFRGADLPFSMKPADLEPPDA